MLVQFNVKKSLCNNLKLLKNLLRYFPHFKAVIPGDICAKWIFFLISTNLHFLIGTAPLKPDYRF